MRAVRAATVTVIAAALSATGLVTAIPAGATIYGSLTERAQCFSDTTSACVKRSEMDTPLAVAVSPDGKNVYVADGASTVNAFSRSSTGALTPLAGAAGCLSMNSTIGCTVVHNMSQPSDIVVSPDGNNVYVADVLGDAIVAFARNPTTGALTQRADPNGCYTAVTVAGCTAVGVYLDGPRSLALSSDGASLYVAAAPDSNSGTVDEFARAGDGSLTFQGCFGTSCLLNLGGELNGANDVAVSPDGASVYTASSTYGVLNIFSRNASTGALSLGQCLGDSTDFSCTAFRGYRGLQGVAVSADNKNLYTTGMQPQTAYGVVAVFNRSTAVDTLGALTQKSGTAGCFSDGGKDYPGATTATCTVSHGVGMAVSITLSGDGRNAYVAGYVSETLAILQRSTSGALSQATTASRCVSETGSDGCANGFAVKGPAQSALSPNGRQLYVVSNLVGSDDGLTIFTRHQPPTVAITAGPSGDTGDHTPTFKFTANQSDVTFQCKVDGAAYKTCGSPYTTAKLNAAKHTFYVRGKNSAGDVSDPATRSFRVVNPPAPANFSTSPYSVKVSSEGYFTYWFNAKPGLAGSIRVHHKTHTYAKKSFTVPSTGKVTVKLRLSLTDLNALKKAGSLPATATVKLTNVAGTTTASAPVTLKAP